MSEMADVLRGQIFAGRELNERQIAGIAAALSAAGFGQVREKCAEAWDAAVNEADRQWQIGRGSASILKADNPYREGQQ